MSTRRFYGGKLSSTKEDKCFDLEQAIALLEAEIDECKEDYNVKGEEPYQDGPK